VSGLVVLGGPLGPVAGTVTRTAPNRGDLHARLRAQHQRHYTVSVNGATDASGKHADGAFGSAFKTLRHVPPVLALSAPPSGAWLKVKRPELVLILSDSLSGVDPATKGSRSTVPR
jgi:hypothetical protein